MTEDKQPELTPEEKTYIQEMQTTLIAQLETVFDPEFPVIDIYTLGLIYEINVLPPQNLIHIIMTFTTPACPMGEMIEQMTKNSIYEVYPDREIQLTITFDPLRNPKMIRDEDLQRMFE